MMPLALLGVGESGTITDIRGKEEVVHHLHNLGFAAGTDVEVVGTASAHLSRYSPHQRAGLWENTASRPRWSRGSAISAYSQYTP